MSNDSLCVIEIPDITPTILTYMLHNIYGLDIPSLDDDIMTKIIRAADKYGLVNLKLEAEASYVSSIVLTLENVMEHLQFADSNNCAYLKKQAVDFVVGNKFQVLKGKILVDSPESCLSKCIGFGGKEKRQSRTQDGVVKEEEEYNAMCISELRRIDHHRGLHIDGSREALISALETYDNGDEE